MNNSGEAADQVIRMYLNGIEVAAKLTGTASKQIAVLLYAVLRDQKRTKGKERLTSMLRSGKELKVFAVKDGDLQTFCKAAKLYMYTAIAPVPLSSFAGEPTQRIGFSFLKSYAAVCLEGAIIVLACVIFSVFASSPPAIDPSAAAVTMVWSYIGELVFNMLILVGTVKMADRVVHEMIGV